MNEIIEEIFLTGATYLLSNDHTQLIVYEQIVRDIDFVPLAQGIYKFHFCVISTDNTIECRCNALLSYGAFCRDYTQSSMDYFHLANVTDIQNVALRQFVTTQSRKFQSNYY